MTTPKTPPSNPTQVRKGLEGVVVSETVLSEVDGARGRLIYRGFAIEQLVGQTSYEEVSFLLLHGHLPSRAELTEWTSQLASRRVLAPDILKAMQLIPVGSPMAYLRTVISLLGLADAGADERTPDTLIDHAIELIAKIPVIVATFDRLRKKRPMLGPRQDLGQAENFLYMLHGEQPSPQQADALDRYFVLLAEHGFNASTFSARTTVATQTDFYSGIVTAIGTLKGPLHGAANRRTMEMLLEIGSLDQVESYVSRTLADHRRFMGFGHRVYKGEDPRARHLRGTALELAKASNEPKWFDISERLQEVVMRTKQLYVNVDFYSATLLYYLGIPVELFTTMFACARIAGWSAHILEQCADNRLIRPLAKYVGPRDQPFVPLDQRPEAAPTA